MKKNSIIKNDNSYYRILEVKDNNVLAIDCIKKTMPKWHMISHFDSCQEVSESDLLKCLNIDPIDIEELSPENKKIAYERYTLIAAVLPFISDKSQQNKVIASSLKIISLHSLHFIFVFIRTSLSLCLSRVSILIGKLLHYLRIRFGLHQLFWSIKKEPLSSFAQ